MDLPPFRFPPEYYEICSSNFNRRRNNGNWFCNRSLSPELSTTYSVQDKTITSSDDSLQNDSMRTVKNQQDPSSAEIELNTSDMESTATDEKADPDYNPSESDSSLEISLTSPQIFCSPEGLSSSESLAHDSSNELVQHTETTVVRGDKDKFVHKHTETEIFTSKTSNTSPIEINLNSMAQTAYPDYNYSGSNSSSEISLTSPQIFCSPEGLSSSESLSHDSNNDLVEHTETTVAQGNKDKVHKHTKTGSLTAKIINTSAIEVNSDSKKTVFCYFCESYVLHFPRHIFRNHKTEFEVQKILALPPLSKERKNLLFSLRKKGNYLTSNEVTKPVRRSSENTNYLPCTYCLGFYSAKNLWRHRKQCNANPAKGASARNSQADAQNFLIRHLRVDPQLKTDVFPRMRADQISLVAKKDSLICAFASRYLKIHREKHFITVASRKMRELARILIEARKIKPSIENLFGALKAENYDVLVSATKAAARYDYENQTYQAPTFALHMGTTLKQCCDIALVHALKKSETFPTMQSANTEAELKTLILLIEGNWKFDVSSQASSDLSLQKWNKVSLVPLASDLKLLKDCLIDKANAAISKLQENTRDANAYIILLETIYCRLLLLNRRRPGELQRLLIKTYKSAFLNQNIQAYEEFSEAISETEKILMNNFKRIVIRGKRGRGVPVLISRDVQDHLDIILKCRDDIIRSPNNYLFGNPKSSQPIIGYKVLRKYAILCGAKNPDALTCTRLRKHLATLTQLFNMSENDMEQLASFMGHTLGIHRTSYRLPDDIYQTAKISKLLILMEKGEAGQFKGKSLDEITLNLEEDLLEQTDDDLEHVEEILAEENEFTIEGGTNDLNDGQNVNNEIKKMATGRKRLLIPWTEHQKKIVITYFKTHIKEKRPPKKSECEDLISKYPELLKNKNWVKIKVFVQNKYRNK